MRSMFKEFFAFVPASLGPNVFALCILILTAIYFQQDMSIGPAWKDVAFGAMSVSGVLGSFGYRAFMKRVKDMEDMVREERRRRDAQHEATLAVLVDVIEALKTGNVATLTASDVLRRQ